MALVLLQIINSCFKSPVPSVKIVPSYRRQRFSLPEPILHYISKNPSNPKTYQKLIQSCKYFFIKNPILILHCLQYENKEWKICDNCSTHNFKKFDIQKYFCKIWATCCLQIIPTSKLNQSIFSTFLQEKLVQNELNDLCSLRLYNQNLQFDEIFPRFSSLKRISLFNVSLKSADGKEASIETILSNLPNLEVFYHENEVAIDSPDLVENLLKIPRFSNIFIFRLGNVSESFDIEKLYSYVKKNQQTYFLVRFDDTISVELQNRLQEIVNEILKTPTKSESSNVEKYLPLRIIFPGENRTKSKILKEKHEEGIQLDYWRK